MTNDDTKFTSHYENGIDGNESTKQFLTFFLAQECYGVEIMCVREIKGWETATRLPNSVVFK